MKKIITLCLLILILLLVPKVAIAEEQQGVLTIKPGVKGPGTQIGIDRNRFSISGGLDYYFLSIVGEERIRMQMNLAEEYNNLTAYAELFVPNIEVRFYLEERAVGSSYLDSEGVAFYGVSNLFRTFSDLSWERDGNDRFNESHEELLEDLLEVWGGRVGVGAEYKANSRVGLVGETGIGFILSSAEQRNEDLDDNFYRDARREVSTSLAGSYTTFGVNFYF